MLYSLDKHSAFMPVPKCSDNFNNKEVVGSTIRSNIFELSIVQNV